MEAKIVKYNTRTQQKIDTSDNWGANADFVPLKGEICIYSDLKLMKIGDGITKISELSFCGDDLIYLAYIIGNNYLTDLWTGEPVRLTQYFDRIPKSDLGDITYVEIVKEVLNKIVIVAEEAEEGGKILIKLTCTACVLNGSAVTSAVYENIIGPMLAVCEVTWNNNESYLEPNFALIELPTAEDINNINSELATKVSTIKLNNTVLPITSGVVNIPLASTIEAGVIKPKSTVASINASDYTPTPIVGGSPYYAISKIKAGSTGATTNEIATDPYITTSDATGYKSQIRLKGAGGTTVKSDASGNVTITSTDAYTKMDKHNPTGTGTFTLDEKVTFQYNSTDKSLDIVFI